MLKNGVGSPRVKCFSSDSQSVTWACTTFLSSHQQLFLLRVGKKEVSFNLSMVIKSHHSVGRALTGVN